MSPTLVTGASGLLGGALTATLIDRGEDVVALTRDPAAGDVDPRAQPLVADITDRAALQRAIRDHGVTTVFHLAAQATVDAAISDPATTYTTNIMGTTAVMDAAAASGSVERVVVASSASAYGPAARAPHTEDMELAPTNAYDISKAAMDLSSRAYHATHGLPVATARLSNVYGPGDRNTTRLIPELIAAALDGRAPRIRSDGTPRRGFLHLDDAVDAYLAIADALTDTTGAHGQAFNAGWPEPLAVGDVVATLEDVLDRPLGALYELQTDTAATPSCQYVSNAKLTAATGWTPKIDLAEGLRRTVAWYVTAAVA